MSDLSGAPAPSAVPPAPSKPTLVQTAKTDAMAVESWFAKHPRAIFFLVGVIVGMVLGHFL
ncbi:MAG: hypothetical protein KGL39_53495 [Patescibacteria group bacterium]|nr:hypothetical protein [Patescibacteria group bacterium]